MRTTVLAITFLVLATPATAVVQNGSSPSNDPGEGMMGITSHATADAARSSQTFGGEDGNEYDVTFTASNTSSKLVGDKIVDVSKGESSLEFTGYIELPTPCHELSTSFEETDELVMTVEASSTADMCAQQVVTKQYDVEVRGSQPFRLEVRHATSGLEVRTMETEDYKASQGDGNAGILGFFSRLLDSLF